MKKFKHCYIFLIGLYSQLAFGQQNIDAYITDSTKNILVSVADSTNSLVSPIDLDFKPRNE